MSAIRLLLKEFCLPKRIRNKIVQTVAYVKNRTISQRASGIIEYEEVNKSVLFVSHLHALGYRCYFHDPNTIICQTMHDGEWKDIMVEYKRVNQ